MQITNTKLYTIECTSDEYNVLIYGLRAGADSDRTPPEMEQKLRTMANYMVADYND